MCDTMVATGATTTSGSMLFGKNSDRQRNEAQAVEYIPATEHRRGEHVRCTYVSVPQVPRTHGLMLCRPFWMWGAEMGANDHGVVIGNEGLHARSPPPEKPALLGMDLLRLTLERASSAAEAVDVLTGLLERHGQGGNCGHLTPSYYQNGYLIADHREAFVLETIDREWLVERVRGVRAISNRYSIGADAWKVSSGLSALLRSFGWDLRPQSYAETITHSGREHIGYAAARRARSTTLLQEREGALDTAAIMQALRDHGTEERRSSDWSHECMNVRTLCMHAGTQARPGQTVGSMVSELAAAFTVHWVTATAAPCISIFKPLLPGIPVPSHGNRLSDRFDGDTLWWRHERSHRSALMQDFQHYSVEIRAERDALEAEFRRRVASVIEGGTLDERRRVVESCWNDAMAAENGWRSRLTAHEGATADEYLAEWQRLSDLAGVEPEVRIAADSGPR